MNNAKIYLCKADCSLLGTITGIQTETCNLVRNATDLWELTFDVSRFVEDDGELVQANYYDSIDDMMRLYLDSEDVQAFFVIDSEPVIKGDNAQETKTVTAHSIECELSNIYLKNFKVNCGTYDSQEYLAEDENKNHYNVNNYTGLPYEYISLVNYSDPQLSLLHLALQGTGWTVKEDIDPDVCRIKKSFDTSGSVYSFLMKTVSPTASVIFEFDRKNKQVGIVKADEYGVDTGVFITMRNLMNSFEVTSSSEDNIITKLIPTGANELGIRYVNFGEDYILNLDYFMNTLNEYGNYKYVSAELHDKYNQWKNYRETEEVKYNGKSYTRRELYKELTQLYNQTVLDISDIHSRLPNDGCFIDYSTYPLEELEMSLTAYENALAILETIYKKEYGVETIGDDIKNTPYWYDYYAYKQIIIPKVEEAIKNYNYGQNVNEVDAYLYEFSLYGLDELESKKKAWSEAADILFEECFIASKDNHSTPTSYRTPDDEGWNSLDPIQKSKFTTKEAYINKLNQYLDYMSFNERTNSLTKKKGKGIIRQCDDAIAERTSKISVLAGKQKDYESKRKELVESASMNNFFTEKDLPIVNSMIREQDYSNENILITNLDDAVSEIDAQEELYQAAVGKLYEISQPQYSLNTELDNLYSLDEFKSYQKPFNVGNFIRVGTEIHEELFDNNFIKLRLISISHNPLEISENLSVEFSTMTKSLNGISDLAFLLDSELSSGSGTSSSTSSSGSGTYGNNDANVQISNNMLNALLSTELFGTAVTDVILDTMKANRGNFNSLFAHSGIFDLLEAGQLKISGDCLVDYIQSNNFVEPPPGTTDGLGSRFDLTNGQFESYTSGGNYIINDGSTLKIKMDNFKIDDEGNANFKGNITGSSGIIDGTFSGKVIGAINIMPPTVCCVTDNNLLKISIKYLKDLNGGQIKLKFTYYKSDNLEYHSEYEGLLAELPVPWDTDTTTVKFSNTEINNGSNEDIFIKRVDIIDNDDYEIINIELVDKKTDTTIVHYDGNIINGNFINKLFINTETGLIDSDKLSVDFDTGLISGDKLSIDFNDGFINGGNNINTYTINCTDLNILTDDIEGRFGSISCQGIISDLELKTTISCSKLNFMTNQGCYSYLTYDDNHTYRYSNIAHKRGNSNVSIDTQSSGYSTYLAFINEGYSVIKENIGSNSYLSYVVNSYIHNIIDAEGICGSLCLKEDNSIIDSWNYGNYIKCTQAYNERSFSGLSKRALYIGYDGSISAASSSRRYKQDISSELDDYFNPHSIYNLPVCQFRYNEKNGGGDNSELYIGFIAEDVAKYYPAAARWNKDHTEVDTWEMSDMFPAVVKLIQEHHSEIELLKEEVKLLKQRKDF
ncbi:MAG: tail fiber domain-containing protein [Lachnospiraceae bacterium]|nr:tail fiber domain-containing protein [Lachnospiraceae bacterium]